MKAYFERMLEYNHWANTRCIEALKRNTVFMDYPQCLRLMSHVINAAEIWLCRIEGGKTTITVWQEHQMPKLDALEAKGYADWQHFLADWKPSDQSEVVSYQNTQGAVFQNIIPDIMAHVFNHGTYHRGQIAKIIVAAGLTPPITDFIAFARE